jgi:hypothetical protein
MRHVLLLIALLVLACLTGLAVAGEKGKGTKVKLGDLSATTPSTWIKGKADGRIRIYGFRLPKSDDDEAVTEVAIFKSGGSAKANIDRWKKQFTPPKGKKLTDVAKTSEIKVGGNDASQLDITGTYNAPPFDPTFKGKKMEGFRLIGIQVDVGDNTYQIKLIGPAKNVEKHRKEFETWVKSFKK